MSFLQNLKKNVELCTIVNARRRHTVGVSNFLLDEIYGFVVHLDPATFLGRKHVRQFIATVLVLCVAVDFDLNPVYRR